MNTSTSLFEEELEPLNAQIAQFRQQRDAYAEELHIVEAELEKYATARQRFEALQQVCDAFENLGKLSAGQLFWKGVPGGEDAETHIRRARARVSQFERRISGIVDKHSSLHQEIERCDDALEYLHVEVQEAYIREEERQDEFVIEREPTPLPFRMGIMPWEEDRRNVWRFRGAVLVAILFCFLMGTVITSVQLPLPELMTAEVEIPKRLVKLVKKAPPRPPATATIAKRAQTPPAPPRETEAPKPKPKPEPEKKAGKPDAPPKSKGVPAKAEPKAKPSQMAKGRPGGGKAAARKKAERVGVLAFKHAFKDLMAETPVAKVGTEAHLRKDSLRIPGQAVARRSLVTSQAKGGYSGGIAYASVSRNIGNGSAGRFGSGIGQGGYGDGLGGGNGSGSGSGNGVGLGGVKSSIANIEASARPVSDGPGLGRTDEEIQIVFDRYKATLYRIYNKELRKDPTLRGKILLRLAIEENGAVSFCEVESTDLASADLVSKIVARIKRFNFGYKEGVEKLTILYPIDFLPAG